MTIVTKEQKIITFINVFTVDPVNQQRLVELLIKATDTSVRHAPGFISASLHAKPRRRESHHISPMAEP